MKPKFEKNIFIKRIINNMQYPKSRIFTKSSIISSAINTKINSHRVNPKQCYIKPHPIFIISNQPKQDQNFIYIKANNYHNTERNKSHNYLIKRKNKYDDYINNTRSKSFDIAPFEHIEKIKKYFNNKYEKIKFRFNKNSFINDTSIDSTNYNRSRYNTMNNIEGNNNNIKYKTSKSKDIIKLCKVLKKLNKNNNNGIFLNEKKSISINENILDNVIKIQKWWKEMIYKKYLKEKIINIQKIYRGYIFRKKFFQILCILQKYSNYEYLDKIIFIQRFWKNYLMNNNQISMSFSFTNNEENNNTIHKDIIYIDNNNSNNKNDLYNSINKDDNTNSIKNRILINSCLYTKKYYANVASIYSDIILIQKSFKKYLFNKQKDNSIYNRYFQKIYQKKSLNNKKIKSRNNTENITNETNIKNVKKKDIFKSLIIVSPEKEFKEIQYHTPKKEKTNKIKFEEIITRNTNKELIFRKHINNICIINKTRKDINLDTKIKYLQKIILNFLKKGKRIYNINNAIIKDINNICFIDKIYGYNIISNNLKNKINILQINIKNFLKRKNNVVNNEMNSPITNKMKTLKINKINLSKEIFQSTNDISSNKNNSNNDNNAISNISEFIPEEINNKNNRNENIFISNNLNTFSFDFKNTKNENIEDDEININMISPKIQNANVTINFSSKNILIQTERYYSYKKLKKLFIANISNKFANFLMNVLNKLYLYNFIKLFSQKINKNINQYVYFSIFNKKKEKNEIVFFSSLKRHILYNIKMNNNNQIKNLLIENIPKSFRCYNEYESIIFIPYINSFQENNLINTQLFIDNNDNLINYFINFYNEEKENLQINHTLLKNILNKYKLYNRNIFTLTKYFDDAIELLLNNKLCKKCLCPNINCICIKTNNTLLKQISNKSKFNYIKKKCNYISKLYKKKKEKEKGENINDEFFNLIDEEEINSDDDELEENVNDTYFNKNLNNSYIIRRKNINNLLTYHNDNIQDNHEYKFFDYLNEKSKNNKYNETLPITYRENHSSFINNKLI